MAHVRKYRDAYEGAWDKRSPDEHEAEMDDFGRYLDKVALEGACGSAKETTDVANTLDVMIAGRHERWPICFQSKGQEIGQISLRYHAAALRSAKGSCSASG